MGAGGGACPRIAEAVADAPHLHNGAGRQGLRDGHHARVADLVACQCATDVLSRSIIAFRQPKQSLARTRASGRGVWGWAVRSARTVEPNLADIRRRQQLAQLQAALVRKQIVCRPQTNHGNWFERARYETALIFNAWAPWTVR